MIESISKNKTEMTQEEIIEGNALIAEFMGCVHSEDKAIDLWEMSGLCYHYSWDWLMPVVEKIESIDDAHHGHFGIYISSNNCTIQATNFRSAEPLADPPYYFTSFTLDSKIQSTWIAIMYFIQWYQKQSTPTTS